MRGKIITCENIGSGEGQPVHGGTVLIRKFQGLQCRGAVIAVWQQARKVRCVLPWSG